MLNKEYFIHRLEEEYFDEMIETVAFDNEVMFHYKNYTEKKQKPDLIGKTVKATKKQFSKVYFLARKIAQFLDMKVPEIYIYEDFYYGVESKGAENYWIEISANTVKDFSAKELKFLLAREILDIYLKHTYYYTMIRKLLEAVKNTGIVGTDTISKAGEIVMYKWSRVSHYTSDNFGYLMVKDIIISVKTIIKLILNNEHLATNVNISEYTKQAEIINLLNDDVSIQTKLDEKVPYGPFRIKNLLNYASSARGKKALKAIH